jgi:nucleoid-associated protein YgaU
MNFKRFAPILIGAVIGYFIGMAIDNSITWVEEAQMGDHPIFIGSSVSPDNIVRNWKASQIKKAESPTDRQEAYLDAHRKAATLTEYALGKAHERNIYFLIGDVRDAIKNAKALGCDMSSLESMLPRIEKSAAERNADLEIKRFYLYITARLLNQGTVGANVARVYKAIACIDLVEGDARPFEKRFQAMLPKGINMDSKPVRYEVKPNEYLSGICLRFYGDGSRQRYEMEAKRLGIEDPDHIEPGQIFIFFKPVSWFDVPRRHQGHYYRIR